MASNLLTVYDSGLASPYDRYHIVLLFVIQAVTYQLIICNEHSAYY